MKIKLTALERVSKWLILPSLKKSVDRTSTKGYRDKNLESQPSMHAFSASTQEAETGRVLQVQDQPALHSEF